MAQPNFDYEGALNAGYSEAEIGEFLKQQPNYKTTNQKGNFLQNIANNASNFFGNLSNPTGRQEREPSPQDQIDQNLLKHSANFDVQGALESGYSPEEIIEFLETNKPERSALAQVGRIGTQFGLGLAENALLPYEVGVAPLASQEAMNVPYREQLGEELENLLVQKASGQWTPENQNFLESIQEQIKDPRKSMEFAQTADLGVRGLAEKVTGQDLHPEGALEKAASWAGFIKDPAKLSQVIKTGVKMPEIIKAIAPTGREALRGVGAGVSLEAAEQGKLGPIGTMAAAVLGDVIGHGAGAGITGTAKLITKPKQTLAEIASSFTSNEKRKLQQDIIKDFRDAGLQADLGTITDSNLIKWTQSRLAQSGLAGKALDDFRHELTDQIKREYKELADGLGNAKFASSFEAGEVIKNSIRNIRDLDLAQSRQLYSNADKALKERAFVDSRKLGQTIERIEKSLKPGAIKSSEQQSVLHALEKLKQDIYDSEGNLIYASVKDLMNNKIALNDIINYEVQGGSKQLLKSVVSELDRAIISYGKENLSFAKNYLLANKKFSEHAKTFRNKDIHALLKTENPTQLMSKMNSIHGMRTLDRILSKTPEGKETLRNLKRAKLDEVIGNNLIDSTTQQARLGTFSKLLEKGKNRELIKELLPADTFKRLERLQKNAGRLADAADKFYNASKSGSVAADAAVIATGLSGIAHILQGNPWPLLKTAGGVLGARRLSQLLADPEFLKLTEDAILAAEKGSTRELVDVFQKLRPYILQLMQDPLLNEQ